MGNMRLYLRPGEKLYINGAVIRVDRKVSVELLNDVTFLLENHVMQVEDATTPVKQLYFVAQTMLMEPANAENSMELFDSIADAIRRASGNAELRDGIGSAEQDVKSGKPFNALKTLRHLFDVEDKIFATSRNEKPATSESSWEMGLPLAKQMGV